MDIRLTPQLTAYMKEKAVYGIIVEVASCDHSDLEITELHTHFVSEKQAQLFIKRQHFHPIHTPDTVVLLPNYRLELQKEIVFDLRKIGPFAMVKATGIDL